MATHRDIGDDFDDADSVNDFLTTLQCWWGRWRD